MLESILEIASRFVSPVVEADFIFKCQRFCQGCAYSKYIQKLSWCACANAGLIRLSDYLDYLLRDIWVAYDPSINKSKVIGDKSRAIAFFQSCQMASCAQVQVRGLTTRTAAQFQKPLGCALREWVASSLLHVLHCWDIRIPVPYILNGYSIWQLLCLLSICLSTSLRCWNAMYMLWIESLRVGW